LDGIDILRHLETGAVDFERTLFWRARRGGRTWRAVRAGDWKLVTHRDEGIDEQMLFNLAEDPGESRNRWADEPERRARMQQALVDWEAEVKAKK
jgi:arylsulfatase A-like enzyme